MKIAEDFVIETDRCRLRIPSLTDIPHVFSATRHPGFNDGMVWNPPRDESELIEPYESALRTWRNGEHYGFTIEGKAAEEFIGRISIRRESKDGVWNIGFFTHPEHQGRGYMTEAGHAVVRFGFSELAAQRIEARHALWNRASETVLSRLGMHFVEALPEGFMKNGEWVPENKLAITREDWESALLEGHIE